MKNYISLSFFLLLSYLSFAQKGNVRGFVYEPDGEPAVFMKVKLLTPDSNVVNGASTDLDGFYSITGISKGTYIVKIEDDRHDVITKNVTIERDDQILDFDFKLKLRSDVVEMGPVIINADDQRNKTEVLTGVVKLDQKAIERIPSLGGENDIVSAIGITPGVTTTGDQGGQIYIRGGTPIQNKVLLDGMTIYSPFHSIGFFSVFETELVKNVDVYTGGFDATYGGRVSSIMDITYRDGNSSKFSGKASISPFMGKLVLEGPMFTPKGDNNGATGTYIFSAKQSLIDKTAPVLYSGIDRGDSLGAGMPFSFTDLYGKMTFKGFGGSKFSVFGFHNRDKVNYGIANVDWTQSGGGLNFILIPTGSRTVIKGHVNGSNYATNFVENLTNGDSTYRFSSIGGFDLGFDFTYFLPGNGEMNYGINLGGFNTDFRTINDFGRTIGVENWTTEIGMYVSYRYVSTRWVIQPSMRLQVYATLSEPSPEPRLAIKYVATEKLRLKASGGRYSQNFTSASSDKDVVNIFNGMLSAPDNVQSTFFTLYKNEKTPRNGLQYGYHAIAGFEYDVSKQISVNVEGYYKYFSQLSNINQNKQYEDDDQHPEIDDVYKKDFILENGQTIGGDVLIKYSGNRLFIWGVYSLGKSIRWDGFDTYAPVFDRRHNVNFVGTYLFGKDKDLEVSIRWNLGSGLPFTPTTGFYEIENFAGGITSDPNTSNADDVSVLLGDFNSERLTYYHRLDISVKKQFIFKNKSVFEAIASATNVYNRKNIFYVNRVTSDVIYQFPILPSLGVSYKW